MPFGSKKIVVGTLKQTWFETNQLPKLLIMRREVKTANIAEAMGLIAIAESKNIKVCTNYKANINKWPYFALLGGEVVGSREQNGILVTCGRMIEILSNIRSVVLNESYKAIIDKELKVINVGCQEFPLSVIKEMHDIIGDNY